MDQVFWLFIIVVAAVAAVAVLKWMQAEKKAEQLRTEQDDFRKQISDAQNETSAAKEALKKKVKQLEESKTEAKKKARREGRKENREQEQARLASLGKEADPSEVKKLKKTIAALEMQIKTAQKDQAKAQKESAAQHASEIEVLTTRASDAEKEIQSLKDSIKKKKEARPRIPESTIDLKSLPVDVVQEMARHYRKGEEYEKLYNVAQGQLNASKERNSEMQKRYYAVCRELAVLATGNDAISEEDAASAVSEIVQSVDGQARLDAERSKPAAEKPAKKKKRRRRKKSTASKVANGKPSTEEEANIASSEGDSGSEEQEASPPAQEQESKVEPNASEAQESASGDTDSGAAPADGSSEAEVSASGNA